MTVALTDFSHSTQQLLAFAIEQGEYAEDLRENDLVQTHRKNDGSPVTNADIEISKRALKALPAIINSPVISEEHQNADVTDNFWLIDPIDGTKSYLGKEKGYKGWAVSIAYIELGRPTAGVIVAPSLNSAYLAEEGKGAIKINLTTQQTQALQVNSSKPFRFAGFYYRADHQAQLDDFLEYHDMPASSVKAESAVLKYMHVADGGVTFGGGWSPLDSWDIAAADLIVHEAGGWFGDMASGVPFDYNPYHSQVAAPMAMASASFHKEPASA